MLDKLLKEQKYAKIVIILATTLYYKVRKEVYDMPVWDIIKRNVYAAIRSVVLLIIYVSIYATTTTASAKNLALIAIGLLFALIMTDLGIVVRKVKNVKKEKETKEIKEI